MSAHAPAPRRVFPLLVLLLLACVLAMLGVYLRSHDAAAPTVNIGANAGADSGGRVEAYDGYWFGMSYEEAMRSRKGKRLSPLPMRVIPAEKMAREEGLSAGFSYPPEPGDLVAAPSKSTMVLARPGQGLGWIFVGFRGYPAKLDLVDAEFATSGPDCRARFDEIKAFYTKQYGRPAEIAVAGLDLDRLKLTKLKQYAAKDPQGNEINQIPSLQVWPIGNEHFLYFGMGSADDSCGKSGPYAALELLMFR